MYKNKAAVALYMVPALLLVALFVYIPIGLNFWYSLFRWSAFSVEKIWVGFENYSRLFQETDFWVALRNNVWYAVISVIFQVGVSLVIASVLESKMFRPLSPVFATIYFIPSVISITIVALLWQMLLNPNIGIFNGFLELIGLGRFATDWLGSSKTAIYSVIAVSQWQYMGYTAMLFIVAIQKIPEDYYEAAMLDGANGIQQFRHITVPNCKEIILLNLTVTIIGAFKVFDEVYVMTGGGPGRSSEVLGTYLYRAAFRNDQMGYATAISSVLFIITFILSIIQIRMYNVRGTR
ncbi:MAG TPA: sugar ABC transporter permease [Clostridiaceae bacterium]|nr:sugar ABC transporter permease [Clostridiaceae bacterium]